MLSSRIPVKVEPKRNSISNAVGATYTSRNGSIASSGTQNSAAETETVENGSRESTKYGFTNRTVGTETRISNGNGSGSHRTSIQSVEADEKAVDTKCGYKNCQPNCLQSCNNTKAALAVLSLYALIQGFVVNGILNVNVTQAERRFGLSSLESSVVISSYDVAAGIFVIPIGYYGRLGHKPRWLATACLLMGIGSGIMFLPHVTTGPYTIGERTTDLCRADNKDVCGDPGLRGYLGVFILAQLLHGIGGTTLYTLGLIWLDDNVELHQASLYFGIFQSATVIGPALGFMVGGKFLDFYVDFDTVPQKDVTITAADPRWVGAWWLGPLASCFFAIFCSLLLFCFGWEMPDAAETRKTRVSMAHADGTEETATRLGFGMTLKDLPKCTWLLLKNPTFMCLTVSMTAFFMVTGGYGAFLPKFIMNQFNTVASQGAFYFGAVAIPATAGGQLLGGFISSKYKLKVRGLIRLSFVTAIALVSTPVMMARCTPAAAAGINTYYGNSSLKINYVNLSGPCNSDCQCGLFVREPICGYDGVEYFSPCHAGCRNSMQTAAGEKLYINCSCVAANLMSKKVHKEASASLGICQSECNLLPVFLVLVFILAFSLAVANTPMITATLRCIPDNLRGYALAVQWVFIRFFGTIPGPLLFGGTVDNSCNVWQNKCGTRGSCWHYDSFKFGLTMTLSALVIGSVSFLFLVLAQCLYKPPPVTDTPAVENGTVAYIKDGDAAAVRTNSQSNRRGEDNASYVSD
ncbi:solute carrier organic anion transporter family member 4C1-like [Lineus longissimus]|uniref:solute carrier organic anion transporter family member 4C1-like n=1 Tax=Lineus longissimus TaxID=88925 RepID=UPI00315C83A0